MVRWIVDFVGVLIGTALLNWLFKKLPRSLVDNALTGYIDNKIGTALGLSESTVDGFLSEWAVPVFLAIIAVWLWHRWASNQLSKPGRPVSVATIIMIVCAVGFVSAGAYKLWWESSAPSKKLTWVFSGMAGKSDAAGFHVSDIQFWVAKNETGRAVRLLDAYIQSGINSKKQPLLLSTFEHGLIPLSEANPIPPDTKNITLMAEFPTLSETDFMKDWGIIHFVIKDDEQTFAGKIEEKQLREVFDGYRPKAPPPRVSKASGDEQEKARLVRMRSKYDSLVRDVSIFKADAQRQEPIALPGASDDEFRKRAIESMKVRNNLQAMFMERFGGRIVDLLGELQAAGADREVTRTPIRSFYEWPESNLQQVGAEILRLQHENEGQK